MDDLINPLNGKTIDKNKTTAKVRRFFKSNTRGLSQFLLLTGNSRTDLKSPNLSFAPSHSSGINNNENMMQRIFYAESIIKMVSLSLNTLSDTSKKPYKTILINGYLNDFTNNSLMIRINYSGGYFWKLKNEACCEFAIKFESNQLRNNISPVIDLCSYLSDDADVKMQVLA